MTRLIMIALLALCTLQVNSQTLQVISEFVDTNITWTWNWDIASDGDRLVTVNENGTLNINSGEGWQIIQIDSTGEDIEARGVAIDENGVIWITTTEHGLWSYDEDTGLQNFNSENSFLPLDNLRRLAIQDSIIWISTDGAGLIRHDFTSNETTHYTKDLYASLKSDFNLDPFIDASGNMWFSNRECLTKITPNLAWVNEDMRFYISGGNVNDIYIESDSSIWLAMNGGLVHFDGEDYNVILQEQFNNYLQVHKDSKGDIWLSRLSTLNDDGVTVLRGDQAYFFSYEENNQIPSQVFGFVEHQDTVTAVGTIGNKIVKFVFDFTSTTHQADHAAITVYPNPASDRITIQSDLNDSIEKWSLYDLSGREVTSGVFSGNAIDISAVPAGMYNLSLGTGETYFVERITVVR